MTWVLIGVVLLVAFGPVLWLVPSKKDRRLTALRARGRAEGLVVELRRINNPEPEPQERVSAGGVVKTPVIESASYGLMLGQKLRHLPGWRLVRVTGQEVDDPFPGWRYDQIPKGDGRRHLPEMLSITDPLLNGLPDDVAGIEVSSAMLSVFWLEKPGSDEDVVGEIASLLRAFEKALAGLEDEIAASLDINDS